MALNPSFEVEDQTDDDFFDKLVEDDDDEVKVAALLEPIDDGNDSDEVKLFEKLSIGEVELVSGGSATVGENEANPGAGVADNRVSVDARAEESNSSVSSSSFGFDSVVESNNDVMGSETASDSRLSKSTGSAGSGVKEVDWSAFNADSGHNDSNGFESFPDFFMGDNINNESIILAGSDELKSVVPDNVNVYNDRQYLDTQISEAATDHSTSGQDVNSSKNWEDLYPGWKYDATTGQWYQLDSYDANANVHESIASNSASQWNASEGKPEVSYSQEIVHSVVGTEIVHSVVGTVTDTTTTESVANWNLVPQESGITETVSDWNQVSPGNNKYPEHMVFDPQYPGWYYDTITQEWRTLETYASSIQSGSHDQPNPDGFASSYNISHDTGQKLYEVHQQVDNGGSQGFGSHGQDYNWAQSASSYNQQRLWQSETTTNTEFPSIHNGKEQLEKHYGFSPNKYDTQNAYESKGTFPSYEKASEGHDKFTPITESQGFVPANFSQRVNQPVFEQNEQRHANDLCGNLSLLNFSHQPLQSGHKVSYAPSTGRSSAGRPPHALVTFGFGGKIIVMRDGSFSASSGIQDSVGGSISVLNLMEVVTRNIDASSTRVRTCDYFQTLLQQSFPGPLVGGNVSGKDLNKWIDERIANYGSPENDFRGGEVLRLLLSLLKIAYQHYGKLRSLFGNDIVSKEDDVPESAVAKLFASVKRVGAQVSDNGSLSYCLQRLPSEGQIQETAAEVQSLLVSGRTKEALQRAREGQLWGPALVLAAKLGDQLYVDTVKQMALCQLVAGSPLRTLCLLIAGQPADVFSVETTSYGEIPGVLNVSQHASQFGVNGGMLDHWEENLAVITANRTKDDELVLIHLGDCLWKERSEIIGAHICYLVAEANFEPYSHSARLCLIGADHWKLPRTFVTPEAIQRTELYEYSKVLGNSQFILQPFQPYKLIYAHMLAEVGKVSESLKYCQAVLKSLKTGQSPEVDTWRQLASSLEERIKSHQQGGYSTNLAPAKLVGKLFNLFDSTANRVVGGLPPLAPPISQANAQGNELRHQPMGPRVSTSQSTVAMSTNQSTVAMSTFVPFASVEPTSGRTADGNKMTMHNRSVSEPDFGTTPRQDQAELSKTDSSSSVQEASKELSKEDSSSSAQEASKGASRFRRFGFGAQFLQKTMGLVLKPRQDRQAKLGEKNKFYYDEKLKRWVEEGAEPPAEEPSLLPPPTTAAAFQNGGGASLDYNLKSSEGGSPPLIENKIPTPFEQSSGFPPIPPSSNQFSARGRIGVRSRYVDTFHQGGGNSRNLPASPTVPSIKANNVGSNPKFFVPTPVVSSSSEQTFGTVTESSQKEVALVNENPAVSISNTINDSYVSPVLSSSSSSSSGLQRFPSMDTITKKGVMENDNGSFSSHTRRAASWSGSFSNVIGSPQKVEPKPMDNSGSSLKDELHEVEL